MAQKAESESHPYLPSGPWEGFYLKHGKEQKMGCVLSFKDGVLSGGGIDGYGAFTWRGEYLLDTGKINMIKYYNGIPIVLYRGDCDENGIWGNWITHYGSEGFHIWPKDKSLVHSAAIERMMTINR